jgi:adenosylcobinamide-GDP ribazoletransferase
MRQVLLAVQFLTIVPVKVKGDITEQDVAGSAAFFPLAGALQGLLTALPAVLLMKVLPTDIVAASALLFLIISNGGFDLDGLADTADALAVKSSGDAERDRSKRLSVMKDSSSGAIGVIALMMAILMKFVLMQRLLADYSTFSAAAIFFLMPVFSRWATVPVMYHATSARKDGLGRIFIEHTGAASLIISTGIVVLLSLLVSWLNLISAAFVSLIEFCAVSLIAFYLFGILSIKFLSGRFGGLTGDHFGAMTEISENLFLLAAYVWLRQTTIPM